jgi:hypothetical protein
MYALAVRKIGSISLFSCVVFLYFLLVSADVLNVQISLFKIKLGNAVALVLFLMLALGRKRLVLSRELLIPSIWVLAALILSASLSVSKFRCYGYVIVYLYEFVCYFLLSFNLVQCFNSEKLFKLYFLSFKCIALYAFLQVALTLAGIPLPLVRQHIGNVARAHAFSYEPSFYALYMTAFVMCYNALYIFGDKKIKGIKNLVEIVIVNAFLLISTSTGGFFAYFIFFVVCLLFYLSSRIRAQAEDFKKKMGTLVFSLSGFLGLIFLCFPETFLGYFWKFFQDGFFQHHSFYERWKRIVNCWGVFKNHPFFGVGIGGVGPYLLEEENAKIGYGVVDLTLEQAERYDPSSVTTEIFASLGLFGALALILLWCYFFASFKRAISLPGLSKKERGFAIALFVSLIVLMIELQFNQGLFRSYIWLHTGMTMGYLFKLRSQECGA